MKPIRRFILSFSLFNSKIYDALPAVVFSDVIGSKTDNTVVPTTLP